MFLQWGKKKKAEAKLPITQLSNHILFFGK